MAKVPTLAVRPPAWFPHRRTNGTDTRGRLTRLAGLCGVGFALTMAASVIAEGGRPDTFSGDAEVVAFFRSSANQDRAVVAAFLLIPAGCLFLWFLVGLYGRLRAVDRTGGQLSMAVGLGGCFFVTFMVASKLIDNITGASLALSHTYGIDPQEARITAGLAYWVQGASMAGASVLLVAASVLARRAGLVPAWVAVAGYVLAGAAPASVALNGVPILLFFMWIVAAGLVLARGAVTFSTPSISAVKESETYGHSAS